MKPRRHHAALAGFCILALLVSALAPLHVGAQGTPPDAPPSSAGSSVVVTPAGYIDYEPAFREIDCPFVVPWTEEISCGLLSVPENRLDPATATIDIFVTILSSQGRPDADPVILLPGGPGEASSVNRRLFYGLPFRDHRDIILVDPRGSGLSMPTLGCPEVDEAVSAAPITPSIAATVGAYRACHARLIAEGRDLAGYTSDAMVEDVADLARVLGVGSLNLHASGYGARIAVLLADRYPQLVRSMVLDGPAPVAANLMLEEPLNIYGVIRRIAADCASSAACNAAYPALEARLVEVIDRYNRTPAPAGTGYGRGNDILRLILDTLSLGGRSLPALITALFEEDFAAACTALPPAGGCTDRVSAGEGDGGAPLPGQAAEAGGVTGPGEQQPETEGAPWKSLFANPEAPAGVDAELVTMLMQALGYDTPEDLFDHLATLGRDEIDRLRADFPVDTIDALSEGLYASVLCGEEAPFYTAGDVALIAERIPRQFGAAPIEHAAALDGICTFWKSAAVSPATKVLQSNTTPTLVIGGTHDPIAPPRWARRTAAMLDASSVLLFPGYGHGLLAGGDDCVLETVRLFFEQPVVEPASDCVDEMEVTFLLPRGGR